MEKLFLDQCLNCQHSYFSHTAAVEFNNSRCLSNENGKDCSCKKYFSRLCWNCERPIEEHNEKYYCKVKNLFSKRMGWSNEEWTIERKWNIPEKTFKTENNDYKSYCKNCNHEIKSITISGAPYLLHYSSEGMASRIGCFSKTCFCYKPESID